MYKMSFTKITNEYSAICVIFLENLEHDILVHVRIRQKYTYATYPKFNPAGVQTNDLQITDST